MLNHNKKGQVMKWIIGVALLLFATVIIVGIWNLIFSKAEGATAEQLCRSFNALRTQTDVNAGITSFNLIPRTCKKLEKYIPSKDYDQNLDGTKEEISNLIAKCWWMWLEGTQSSVFGTTGIFSKDKCFICYTFNLKEEIPSFKGVDLKKYLTDYVYKVKDTSNMCNVNGGGFCRPESTGCFNDEKQIPSKRCPNEDNQPKQICCNKRVECENKGGICSNSCGDDESEYRGWSCKGASGKCCIKKNNLQSYEKYVVEGAGPGAVFVLPYIFESVKETYAITYYAKTAASGKTLRENLGIKSDPNKDLVDSIIVSRLNQVKDMCAIEADTSGGVSE